MSDEVLTAAVLLALFALGALSAMRPRSVMRWHYIWRALGLTARARSVITRAAGIALVAVSLWLLWRLLRGMV